MLLHALSVCYVVFQQLGIVDFYQQPGVFDRKQQAGVTPAMVGLVHRRKRMEREEGGGDN